MKKTLALILCLTLAVFAFTGCENNADETPAEKPAEEAEAPADTELEIIKVGASATPHAEILEQVKAPLAEAGYELEIVIYDDYVLPNTALADGEIDANYFQHSPYLNSFNAEKGTELSAAALIHYEPFGIYGNGISDLAELKEGASILVPADATNGTRSLLLLQQEGLITLPEDAAIDQGITPLDIVDDGGFVVTAISAETLSAQLENSDEGSIAVINGNYAIQAGLKVENALALEAADGEAGQTFANVIACRTGEENSEKIQALINALRTEAVKAFMEETYAGAVKAVF